MYFTMAGLDAATEQECHNFFFSEMRSRPQLLCSLVLASSFVCFINGLPQLYRGEETGSPRDDMSRAPGDDDLYLTQRLDHFNRNFQDTFQQRYFLNDTLYMEAVNGSSSVSPPVFFCIGGEGPPIDASILVSSEHCNDMVELAPKFGALMVALEHRFYGFSVPSNDWSTSNLQYLSTEQALGDIASFISFVSDMYGLTSENKWVTWGGSYPGYNSYLFCTFLV